MPSGRTLFADGVFEFVHEAFVEGVGFGSAEFGELLDEFFLFFVEFCGGFDLDGDELVALSVAAQVGHAEAAQFEYGAGLCAVGDFEFGFPFERGHGDGRAEYRVGEADGDGAVEVGFFAFKDGIGFDIDAHVEVAAGATIAPGFAFTGYSES